MAQRLSEDGKRFRTELKSHLFAMHDRYENRDRLNLEELEELHRLMHIDQYACPPHEHKDAEEPYELGKIKLKYGKKYLASLVEVIRG